MSRKGLLISVWSVLKSGRVSDECFIVHTHSGHSTYTVKSRASAPKIGGGPLRRKPARTFKSPPGKRPPPTFMSTSWGQKSKSSPQFGRHPTMHDRFAVAIRKGTLTIGHVPAEISKVCCFFSETWGCRVSTDRHRLSPLELGGLEVACELIFIAGDQKPLKKIVSTHTH